MTVPEKAKAAEVEKARTWLFAEAEAPKPHKLPESKGRVPTHAPNLAGLQTPKPYTHKLCVHKPCTSEPYSCLVVKAATLQCE